MESVTDLAHLVFESATDAPPVLSWQVGEILISVFVIAVGFVAFKLIKRALNKA